MKIYLSKSVAAFLIVSLVASLLSVFTVNAASDGGKCGDEVNWSLDTGTGIMTVSGKGNMYDIDLTFEYQPWDQYTGIIKEVVIEDGVTGIGDCAFYGCSVLTSVKIPNSLISVGNYAFDMCDMLTFNKYDRAYYLGNGENPYLALIKAEDNDIRSCTVNGDTKIIGGFAFAYCGNLTEITVPSGVMNIGKGAFEECCLESISVDAYNEVYRSEDNCIIEIATDTLILGCKNSIIPQSVKSIGDRAFCGCNGLTSAVIPNGVTSIGNYAFAYCNTLASVKLPDSLTDVGDCAFEGCAELDFNLYDNAYYLGNDVNPYVALIKEKSYDIRSCTINGNTKVIGDKAFAYLSFDLESVTMPEGIITIGDEAFLFCSQLSHINIPSTVKRIGFDAFYDCSSLTSLTLPDGITSIGSRAFSGCSSLTSLNLPDGITCIPDGMLWGCSGLTSVKLGNNVQSIGELAFYRCEKLKSVTISETLTLVENYAFDDCGSLKVVYYGGTLKQKGDIVIGDDNSSFINAKWRFTRCNKGHFYDDEFDTVCNVCGYDKEAHIIGDADENGTVNADDAIFLLYSVFFPEDYFTEQPSDYDGSGDTDADDAIYLLYHIFFPDDYTIE